MPQNTYGDNLSPAAGVYECVYFAAAPLPYHTGLEFGFGQAQLNKVTVADSNFHVCSLMVSAGTELHLWPLRPWP
jgi:hypothetical protein